MRVIGLMMCVGEVGALRDIPTEIRIRGNSVMGKHMDMEYINGTVIVIITQLTLRSMMVNGSKVFVKVKASGKVIREMYI